MIIYGQNGIYDTSKCRLIENMKNDRLDHLSIQTGGREKRITTVYSSPEGVLAADNGNISKANRYKVSEADLLAAEWNEMSVRHVPDMGQCYIPQKSIDEQRAERRERDLAYYKKHDPAKYEYLLSREKASQERIQATIFREQMQARLSKLRIALKKTNYFIVEKYGGTESDPTYRLYNREKSAADDISGLDWDETGPYSGHNGDAIFHLNELEAMFL